jgi:hypothetical protein
VQVRQPVADRADRLRLDIELVERDLQQAADAAVRLGQAGPAGERLKQGNIGWHLLDDAVEVAEDARPLFDPVLVPFKARTMRSRRRAARANPHPPRDTVQLRRNPFATMNR